MITGMTTRLRVCLGAVALAIASAASACLWDRDTLNEQSGKFPGFFEATVGWFERNPDLYYTMRANRLAREARTRTLTAEELDDMAVALDRTGKSDQAIAIMEQKRALVEKGGGSAQDALYRYHANLATFQIHKWLAKPNRKDPSLVRESVHNLEEAIRINPDAHFGREAVQLNLTKLILFDLENKPNGPHDDAYAAKVKAITSDLNSQQNGPNMTPEQRKAKAIEGITGIIVLGYGYSLSDMYQLAQTQFYNDGKMRWVCEIRLAELDSQGVPHVFSPELQRSLPIFGYQALPDDKERINKLYNDLRAKADKHDAYRKRFMLAKLRKGQHPDWTPTFWNGYRPLPKMEYNIAEPNHDPNFSGRDKG